MKIIYHCFGGSHSSVLAAAVHLKMLNNSFCPSVDEMMGLPYFDKTGTADFGTIRYMGLDDFGNEIYVLGKKNLGIRCIRMIEEVTRLLGVGTEVVTVNCMTTLNIFMMVGGFISRRLGFPVFGRPILLHGTKAAFAKIVNLVEITRLKTLQQSR